jgi:RNA polymerase sigma-70 factor (ECF subfamily)
MTLDDRVRALLDAGDLRGAAVLVLDELGPLLLRFLRSLLRDEADAGDAFADTAERIWSGLPEFRGDASLRTWAFRIAWNVARMQRDEGWRRFGRRLEPGEATALAEELRTKTVERDEQRRQAVLALRASLAPEERLLLALRIDQELPWEEVAGILSSRGARVTVAALQKRFERLKERLAALARERGLLG